MAVQEVAAEATAEAVATVEVLAPAQALAQVVHVVEARHSTAGVMVEMVVQGATDLAEAAAMAHA